MSRRTERVGSLIRSIIADAMQVRLNDPRIERFTSITRVEVSEDLGVAHVFVSVMSDRAARRTLTVEALQSAAGRLRAMVAHQTHLRTVPELIFRQDESVQRSFETVQLIDQVMQEHKPAEAPPESDEPAAAPDEHHETASGRKAAPGHGALDT